MVYEREPGIETPLSKLLHIQLLRGLAALSVAFLHAQHDAQGLAERTARSFEAISVFPFMAGVDVFFVISGFVMVYASGPLYGAEGARGVFLARRFARIAPLYWAVTSLYLAVVLTAPSLLNSPSPSAWMVVASYLFIPATRSDGLVQPLYSLGWTLNYEMFFYALFALVLVFPLKRAVVVLMALLIGLSVAGSLVRFPQPLRFWTDPIVLEFAFGVGLGWLKLQGVTLSRPWRWALSILGVALLMLVTTEIGQSVGFVRPLHWGIPAALLVAAAAFGEARPDAVVRSTRVGAALGDMSYAIYLIHPFVIRGFSEVVFRAGLAETLGPIGFIVLALVATLGSSWVVHLAFERPATRFLRDRLKPRLA
jgi:peptidoglycan/LPS O-acetylase OafA/YrhL